MNRREVVAALTAAGVWPRTVLAQPKFAPSGRLPIVGVLAIGGSDRLPSSIFVSALAALGWVDGRNVSIAVREGGGQVEHLTPLIGDLLAMGADVIVARSGTVAARLLEATRATPIVISRTSLGFGFVVLRRDGVRGKM